MFTLGIPNRQYRRATQVLGPENAYPIEYDAVDQGDGFYVFSFDLDYDGFQDIVMMLKHNGITTIGADSQLTERNIMKLTDLLKEWGKAGYRKDTIILDEIYDKLSYWNPTSVVSYDDYINELDYPGLGGTDKNVQDLVFSYLGFLDNLQQEETKLAKTWEGSYSQASANQINNQMETNLSNLLNP